MIFDPVAPYYRWLELAFAGNLLQRCRTAFFDAIPCPERILLVGEGHGRSLVECRRRFACARITCVDASPKMFAAARRELARHQLTADGVEFIQADILRWEPESKNFDLVITHFFLDCFDLDQVKQIVSRLADCTAPGAHWLVADFQIPPAGLGRLRSRLLLGIIYRFFQLTIRLPARRLVEPDACLLDAGFKRLRRIESDWGLFRSDWWVKQPA